LIYSILISYSERHVNAKFSDTRLVDAHKNTHIGRIQNLQKGISHFGMIGVDRRAVIAGPYHLPPKRITQDRQVFKENERRFVGYKSADKAVGGRERVIIRNVK
jgi:hypothetical protein